MRILVCNDDGIYSPGIAALARVASRFGDVRIVAPDVEMSSAGQAVTVSRPLTFKPTHIGPFESYRVNGTPADCVALGSYNWEKVDVVLSGINLGSNLGNSMWHSGTLAAAKQAVLLGLRGIALSAPVRGKRGLGRHGHHGRGNRDQLGRDGTRREIQLHQRLGLGPRRHRQRAPR